MSGFRARELRAQGLRTRVFEAGSTADQEAVLLLHGAPGSADDWQALFPTLERLGRVVAFDLPGFGEADKPRGWGYSPAELGSFVGAALDGLGIERAHLVMVDLGGAAGTSWAATSPERLASAVLINTGVLIGYRWHALARLHRVPVLGQLVARSARLGFRTAMRLAEPRLPEQARERWARSYRWPTRRAMLRFYRAGSPETFEQLAPALRKLDPPALVLWGVHDRFVPVEQAERQRESFPSAEIILLAESGHYPPLDAPDRVAELVLPFLQAHLGGRRENGETA